MCIQNCPAKVIKSGSHLCLKRVYWNKTSGSKNNSPQPAAGDSDHAGCMSLRELNHARGKTENP
jgi:hypothetical protein